MQAPELERAVKSLRAIADDLGRGAPVVLAWLEWLRGESLAGLSELSITPDTGRYAFHMCPNGAIRQVCTLNFLLRYRAMLSGTTALRSCNTHQY